MRRHMIAVLVMIVLLAAPLALEAQAQSGGGYSLAWSTIDGGGRYSAGGDYGLGGTIGQPDAGASSGGAYWLAGGFWAGLTRPHLYYLPIVLK